jgi:hypothetical protein
MSLNETTATIDLSDELPPEFPLSLSKSLTIRTIQTNANSRPQHSILYPETFPNVEKLIFWRGNVGNIDFDSLGQLPALREILFDGVSFSDDQIQLFSPLQHMKNLTLVFIDEGGTFYGDTFYQEILKNKQQLLILQNFLPYATIKFYSRSVSHENMFSL